MGVGVAAPGIFYLASGAASHLLQANVFTTFVTGKLGVPAYFVILSGSPFGGSPRRSRRSSCLPCCPFRFSITRLGSPWRTRRTKGWFAGAAEPSSPTELYNSFGYSTPIRIMLRFLFRTKESIVRVGSG